MHVKLSLIPHPPLNISRLAATKQELSRTEGVVDTCRLQYEQLERDFHYKINALEQGKAAYEHEIDALQSELRDNKAEIARLKQQV